MNRFYIIFAALLFTSTDLAAQQPRQRDYKTGLNHTYVRRAETPQKTESVTEKTEITDGTESRPLPIATKTEESPTSRVWNKYRALATGKTTPPEDEEQTSAKPAEPEKPETPKPAPKQAGAAGTTQNTALKPTGIAAIIQDYRKNKEQVSQVKSLRIHKPQNPQVNTPAVSTPTLNAPNRRIQTGNN